MRRSAALLVALLLLAVAAVPAEATTVHRVFSASMGNAGFNGLVRITAYTNGTGHVDYALKNLRRGATYQIYAVQTMLSVQSAVSITAEQLWLQTSTGPHGTAAKLVVKAHRLSTVATTYRASHPTPHIVHCGF